MNFTLEIRQQIKEEEESHKNIFIEAVVSYLSPFFNHNEINSFKIMLQNIRNC